MRAKLLVLVAALVVAMVPASQVGACGTATWTFYTLTVKTKWASKVLTAGEKAKVTITVTRPGKGDPISGETPIDSPVSEPVEDAYVGTNIYLPRDWAWEGGYTNEKGKATLKIHVPKTKPGRGYATTGAEVFYNEGGDDCTSAKEVGYTRDDDIVLRD